MSSAEPSTPTAATSPKLFMQLEAHPWITDHSFQAGLSAILTSSSTPSTTAADIEELTLRARCFYYTRTFNVPVNFDEYKAWRDVQQPGATGLSAPLPAQYALSLDPPTSGAIARQEAQSVEPPSFMSQEEHGSCDESRTPAPTSKMNSTQPSGSSTQPDYPASFDEVVQMIQNGTPIPGVKDIPDTVLVGQGTGAAKGKRRKPWEKE